MSLEDFRREIDQLAKLKMNVFQFSWGMGAPWAKFSYGGKVAEILYPKESGYCAWAMNSGTAESVKVGRECFPQDGYMGPPEFAKVQTQEEAYHTAREFLRELIRYAHSRKVQVWLAIGEMTYVPPNLVPPTTAENLGFGRFGPFYCGIAIPHGEPAVLDIYEAAVRSMIETYPEAAVIGWLAEKNPLSSRQAIHRPRRSSASTRPCERSCPRTVRHGWTTMSSTSSWPTS
jgi:hypothetical protein